MANFLLDLQFLQLNFLSLLFKVLINQLNFGQYNQGGGYMQWRGRRTSQNVEDQRGRSIKGIAGGGIGTVILILLVLFMGGDPTEVINNLQSQN